VLARGLEWHEIADALLEADYGWVGLATIAVLATVMTRALRWQALLDGQRTRAAEGDARVGVWSAAVAILVGQAVNTGLPVLRSGDFARAAWTSQREPVGVTQSLGSIVLEKVWDLLALCVTGITLLIFIPLPTWFAQSTWGVLVVVGAGLAVLWVGLRWQTRLLSLAGRLVRALPERLSSFLIPQLHALVRALDAIRQPRASAIAGIWTVMTWVLGGVINWAVMRAFGIQSVPGAILLLATLMLGASAVPTPGRIGVFEGITVVSLAQFDVDANLALAIGLVLHLVVMGPPLVLAALVGLANALGLLSGSRPSSAPRPTEGAHATSEVVMTRGRADDL
jgi:uncharacterized protein (TIRG00374 family)